VQTSREKTGDSLIQFSLSIHELPSCLAAFDLPKKSLDYELNYQGDVQDILERDGIDF
jgi:hypothetical protein